MASSVEVGVSISSMVSLSLLCEKSEGPICPATTRLTTCRNAMDAAAPIYTEEGDGVLISDRPEREAEDDRDFLPLSPCALSNIRGLDASREEHSVTVGRRSVTTCAVNIVGLSSSSSLESDGDKGSSLTGASRRFGNARTPVALVEADSPGGILLLWRADAAGVKET